MAEVPVVAAAATATVDGDKCGDGDVEVPAISSAPDVPPEGFICGVVEGFYGRPWTTEQRKDLFRKLKRWGMDAYIYAPKDDYKHRAYWRELYTVEEADHLTGLITAAHEQNINFYYALSPGLDITYSSPKEVAALKRKLDQVSQFGCKAFALLFDDIEPEMSKPDKEVFQSFAYAQVSVTNEIFNHLNCPRFLFCPTQYCSTRAVPTVKQSEYLNTLGTKLVPAIDILWTGPKVISKLLTVECIEEITEVLRRPPVIWDNLHANDYDQKRVFLGPYSGRSPELIPLLRGVVTNPNCEFHANAIAIQTLAFWSKCRADTSRLASTASEHDIKLETENEDGICQGDAPAFLSENIYHPRLALKNAIANWLPEFFQEKQAWGPITKPQPAVTMVMPIIPIIPSVNTCMTLTSTSTTTTTTATALPAMPEVNTNQLQLFADVCSTVTNVAETLPNPIMNSLVSATKVVTDESLPNPVAAAVNNLSLPPTIPISSISLPMLPCIKPTDESPADEDVEVKTDANTPVGVESGSPQVHVRDGDDTVIRDAEIEGSNSSTGAQGVLDENEVKMVDATEEPDGDDKMMTVSDEAQPVNHHTSEPSGSESGSIPLVAAPSIPTGIEMIEDDSKPDVAELQTGNNSNNNNNNNGVVPPEPMECGSNLTSPKHLLKTHFDDVIMSETTSTCSGTMQVESSDTSLEMAEDNKNNPERDITATDLMLLCDLFYLPFEHGSKALQLLTEFHWLRNNAYVLCRRGDRKNGSRSSPTANSQAAVERPTEDGDITESVAGADGGAEQRDGREMMGKADDAQEWLRRAESFHNLCQAIFTLTGKIARCANKELCYDLFSYVWDVAGVLSLLSGFVRWLALGHFPANIGSYTQGGYTWFSKGWKETFMSGDQEPWVFRGGLVSDLQRLVPIDAGSDLFLYKTPETSAITLYTIRPYAFADEPSLYEICLQTANDGDALVDRPTDGPLAQVVADRYLGPFLTMTPELCLVLEDQNGKAVGYVCAVLDTRIFLRNMEQCWVPEMCLKYPLALVEDCDIAEPVESVPVEPQSSPVTSSTVPQSGSGGAERTRRMVRDSVRYFHQFQNEYPASVLTTHPSLLCCRVLNENLLDDETACKRLLTVVLAALRCNGATQGVHVCIDRSDRFLYQFYAKLGFVEIHASDVDATVYLGRNF